MTTSSTSWTRCNDSIMDLVVVVSPSRSTTTTWWAQKRPKRRKGKLGIPPYGLSLSSQEHRDLLGQKQEVYDAAQKEEDHPVEVAEEALLPITWRQITPATTTSTSAWSPSAQQEKNKGTLPCFLTNTMTSLLPSSPKAIEQQDNQRNRSVSSLTSKNQERTIFRNQEHGDVRCYKTRNYRRDLLTDDHSMFNMQLATFRQDRATRKERRSRAPPLVPKKKLV